MPCDIHKCDYTGASALYNVGRMVFFFRFLYYEGAAYKVTAFAYENAIVKDTEQDDEWCKCNKASTKTYKSTPRFRDLTQSVVEWCRVTINRPYSLNELVHAVNGAPLVHRNRV